MTVNGYAPITVEVFFDLTASGNTEGHFIIGESLIEGVDIIAGEVATDITEFVHEVSTSRGRSRELDTIQTGVATVRMRNYDARFLPTEWYTTGPFPDQIVPGKRVRISMAANSQPIFDGRIDEWHWEYSPTGEVDAWFEAIDALGALASMSFDDWTSTAGETAGVRIAAALDRSEVDWGPNRLLGTGVATLTADAITWGSNVKNYLDLVAATDRGFFFASRRNTVTYLGRDDIVEAVTLFADAAADILADDGSGVPFAEIGIASSSELLFNRVGVDREGSGILQTVEAPASQVAYGVRSLQITGLLNETDDQSRSLAGYLLDQYSEPQNRVSSVTVIADELDPTNPDHVKVPLHDIGDVVKVKWTPPAPTVIGGYFSLATDDKLTVPDEAALDVTGDLDIIWRCRMATWNTAGTAMAFVSKGFFTYDVVTYLNQFILAINGANQGICSINDLGLVNGTTYWFRVTRDATTGAIDWYVRPDSSAMPSSWGSPVTDSGTQAAGAVDVNALTLAIGARPSLTPGTYAVHFTGDIYDVVVKGDAVTVFEWHGRDVAAASSFVANSGQTVTVDGATFNSYTPAQVEQLSLVEGKYHRTSADGLHTITYALSPAAHLAGFIIGDATFGVIGVSPIAF